MIDKNKTNSIVEFSSFLTGFGTLMLGVAAVVAACQTSNVLEKLTKISEKSNQIDEGVRILKKSNDEIVTAISVIKETLLKQETKLATSDRLINPREIIKRYPSKKPNKPGVYYILPDVDRVEVYNKLNSAQTQEEKQRVLEDALQVEIIN